MQNAPPGRSSGWFAYLDSWDRHAQKGSIFSGRSQQAVLQLRRDKKEIPGFELQPGAFECARQADDDGKASARRALALVRQEPFLNLE